MSGVFASPRALGCHARCIPCLQPPRVACTLCFSLSSSASSLRAKGLPSLGQQGGKRAIARFCSEVACCASVSTVMANTGSTLSRTRRRYASLSIVGSILWLASTFTLPACPKVSLQSFFSLSRIVGRQVATRLSVGPRSVPFSHSIPLSVVMEMAVLGSLLHQFVPYERRDRCIVLIYATVIIQSSPYSVVVLVSIHVSPLMAATLVSPLVS